MDVFGIYKGCDHRRVTGEVCEQAQFDLGIVSIDQDVPGRSDKGPSDLLTCLHSDGDILEVWFRAAQPSRGGQRLVKSCVHTAVLRVANLFQAFDIGRAQLGNLAVFDDQRYDRVFAGQPLKFFRVGGKGATAAFFCRLPGQGPQKELRLAGAVN